VKARERKRTVGSPRAPKTEYWTMWGPSILCSKHRTLAAAQRVARQCEHRGGKPHDIVKVVKTVYSVGLKRRSERSES
jgi:hypothetical protein